MTRSLSCAIRGMFTDSIQYHPFGIPLLILFVGIAVLSLFSRLRLRAGTLLDQHHRLSNMGFLVLVTTFIGYGILRAAGEFVLAAYGS